MIVNINNDLLMKKGIYKIVNTITNDFYIGSTIATFKSRIANHKTQYKKYKTEQKRKILPILYNAFDKYGFDNFNFIIIEFIDDTTIIKNVEELYINNLNPKYNVCKEPSKGGSPNKGRKLSKEWRDNIAIQSAKYKHSNDTLELKTKQNKELSSKYRIQHDDIIFEGSLIDCSIFCNVSDTTFLRWFKGINNTKWTITKLKKQSKTINVYMETEILSFKSFGECDRYFNMWRGYTSTIILRNALIIDKYKYEII